MTYNEFMKNFNAYRIMKLKMKIKEYGSAAKLAEAKGISPCVISRALNSKSIMSKENMMKLYGEDIFDAEIKDMKTLEIEYLEKRLKELKGE